MLRDMMILVTFAHVYACSRDHYNHTLVEKFLSGLGRQRRRECTFLHLPAGGTSRMNTDHAKLLGGSHAWKSYRLFDLDILSRDECYGVFVCGRYFCVPRAVHSQSELLIILTSVKVRASCIRSSLVSDTVHTFRILLNAADVCLAGGWHGPSLFSSFRSGPCSRLVRQVLQGSS